MRAAASVEERCRSRRRSTGGVREGFSPVFANSLQSKNSRAMIGVAAHLILSIMFAVNESEWPFRDIRELIHRFKCHSAYLDIGSN